ncbi:GNAT family N-acetyltransferase [Pontibaca salina]|uniref:GNAT family N-acetyltransferase n=1 Tax=Pontibaca salina TaxID=2795731 RepID=A0A934LXR4_9RHOB|nr:GNAT family N-acetyltransferase [Pontibaca salina]MBI6628932.1 GNAT family N-acetyltransferase [Pontibaca salina]
MANIRNRVQARPHAESAHPVEVRALAPSDLPAAAAVLTVGMADNPLHIRVFGSNPKARRRRLSRFLVPLIAYVQANGQVLGAYEQGDLVGVLGMIAPGRCRPGLRDRLRFAGAFAVGMSPFVLWRLRRWLALWARHDPDTPHWHLGPLAVLPARQRRGIGRQLVMHCCAQLDTLGANAWLETDLEINVTFYRTFGFAEVGQDHVLNVPAWFMHRSPRERAC